MNSIRRLIGKLGGQRFRGEILGALVEARVGFWGDQTVLVKGKPVSEKPWAWFTGLTSHFLTLAGPDGTPHNVEVRFLDRSGGLAVAMRVEILLNGTPFASLSDVPPDERADRCPHCAYSLEGLEAVNHEIRCPECGRHTPASLVSTRR
ncbi:MAG: hypothetical protein AB7Q00_02335 [Phycisphaerales bacterium]